MSYYRNFDTPTTSKAHRFDSRDEAYGTMMNNVRLVLKPETTGQLGPNGEYDIPLADHDAGIYTLHQAVDTYAWERLGCPTWQIHPDALEFLSHVKTKNLDTQVRLPKGILNMNFPFGFRLYEFPVRNVLLVNGADKHIRELSDQALDLANMEIDRGEGTSLLSHVDCGSTEDGLSETAWTISRLTVRLPPGNLDEKYASLPNTLEINESERLVLREATRIAICCVYYVQAMEKALGDPISVGGPGKRKGKKKDRYRRRITTQVVKSVLPVPKTASGHTESEYEGHKSPRAHLRGWVLRTLRHQRYKRNEDGSPKTVLVPPHLVGVKSAGDLPDNQIQHLDEVS